MPQPLSSDLANQLVAIASEKRIGQTGAVREDFVDMGLMVEQNGQPGVRLEDDNWYSTKSLGKRLQSRQLGGKSFSVITLPSPDDGQRHVYLVPKDKE